MGPSWDTGVALWTHAGSSKHQGEADPSIWGGGLHHQAHFLPLMRLSLETIVGNISVKDRALLVTPSPTKEVAREGGSE